MVLVFTGLCLLHTSAWAGGSGKQSTPAAAVLNTARLQEFDLPKVRRYPIAYIIKHRSTIAQLNDSIRISKPGAFDM
jgi:hypothetical protein